MTTGAIEKEIEQRPPGTAVDVRTNGNAVGALASTSGSITDLLRIAVERGTPVAELKELVALHEKLSERQAAQEFAAALAAFQQECPPIKKGSTAKIATRQGSNYSYTYAELDDIARTVNPILAKHGLSYSWDSRVDGEVLTCICTLRHAAGHSVTSSFTLPIENPSAMNPQQKVGAALTFAQRRSLSSVLGLTTTDEDSDAGAADNRKISADQVTLLADLIQEVRADLPRFLKFMNVASLSDIKANDYQRALTALEQKRGAQR